MIEFGEPSRYESFADMSPDLLSRGADPNTVSLMGQTISDVLDHGCSDRDVRLMIADLEAARTNATSEEIDPNWALPLATLLGVLRQSRENRENLAAALDPSDTRLRAKVLAAIDAGINTPNAIGPQVQSPTTVISRVLRQLADEGLVEPIESVEDQRQRPYRRVETEEGVGG